LLNYLIKIVLSSPNSAFTSSKNASSYKILIDNS